VVAVVVAEVVDFRAPGLADLVAIWTRRPRYNVQDKELAPLWELTYSDAGVGVVSARSQVLTWALASTVTLDRMSLAHWSEQTLALTLDQMSRRAAKSSELRWVPPLTLLLSG
jgi:hypothetical protein